MGKFVVKDYKGLMSVTLNDVPKSLGYDITHHSKDGVIRLNTEKEAKTLQNFVGSWYGPTKIEEEK